jgi:hypothetical protein
MGLREAFEKLIAALTGSSPAALSDTVTEESSRLFEMLVDALENPEDLFEDFLEALEVAGVPLSDLFRSIIIDYGRQLLGELVVSLRTLANRSIEEILNAVSEASEEALDDVIKVLIGPIARNMTSAEVTEAMKVYGNTFDYDEIYFSQQGLTNSVIFGIQDWFNSNPNSRAFVTMKLVNFDVNDGPMSDDTMIHELCHVYQYQDVGPIYILEAIHAQTLGVGYNYGYTNDLNGDGGGPGLLAEINKNPTLSKKEVFERFNREQQAMIIQHYYVRRYIENRPASDYAPWQPFQDVVFTP